MLLPMSIDFTSISLLKNSFFERVVRRFFFSEERGIIRRLEELLLSTENIFSNHL